MLHRFAQLVAASTVALVLAGSLVTSNGAGLSVPDWPTTYGWSMFTFPRSMWVGNILYEHGHRLIASTVGMLTVVLTVWLWARERRRWLRWLGIAALFAVIAQGVLGGITVLFLLPPAVSTAHAGLAELFLCMTVAIALFTSPGWTSGYGHAPGDPPGVDDPVLRRFATATSVLIFGQIMIGAWMRHTGAGLAIPDFPLMFGRLVPPYWDAKIAVNFAHRIGALTVASAIVVTSAHLWRYHPGRRELGRPAALLLVLVAAQIALGALTVLTRRDVSINSAHVVGGALVFATSVVVTLRSWRARFNEPAVESVPGAASASAGRSHLGATGARA
jgi:heme a synthase